MTRTVRLHTEIPSSRELVVRIPEDIPLGKARIVMQVTTQDQGTKKPERETLRDLLESELFGLWSGRDDIEDSTDFVRELRASAWHRA